jgi:hypothetical protein
VFFDQGGNFEKVQCPACHEDVTNQWPEWMDKAFEYQFADLTLTMPCCGLATNLNTLGYFPAAGFARFSLSPLETLASEACSQRRTCPFWRN